MALWRWLLKRKNSSRKDDVALWNAAWLDAVSAPDAGRLAELETALAHRRSNGDLDVEIEDEMLDGLRQLVALQHDLDAGSLPKIETTHQLVRADRCHFSAPVSMPDDPAQPTGRLLLTSSRAVFAGGARVPGLAWPAVREVVQNGRDLMFVRVGVEGGHRFRCNSFADVLCAAAIARHLMRRARL